MWRPKLKRSVAIAGLGAGLLPWALPSIVRAAGKPVRVGSIASDSAMQVFTAVNNGFFARNGIDAILETFTNGNNILTAILGGSLDIGGVNLLSFAAAYEHGFPFRVISIGTLYRSVAPTTTMIVAKDSKIRTARDLNGTTIGLNVLKGIAHVAAQAWIDKNGGDSKQVRFIELANSTIGPAIASGRFDAGVLPEPYATESRNETRVFCKVFDGIAPRWMIDAHVATQAWINADSDRAQRVNRAMLEAAHWANHNQDKTAVVVSNMMKLDINVVRSMNRATFLEKRDLSLIQPVLDAGYEYGALPNRLSAISLFS